MGTKVSETETEKGINSLLQLCMKAGKLVCGIDATLRLLSRKKIFMIIYSKDLAANSRHKILGKCAEKEIPTYCYSTKLKLGKLFNRRETGILSISDRNFASGIVKKLAKRTENETNWEV